MSDTPIYTSDADVTEVVAALRQCLRAGTSPSPVVVQKALDLILYTISITIDAGEVLADIDADDFLDGRAG